MNRSAIFGWRTFLIQLAMVASITMIAVQTQAVDLVTAVGVVFGVIHGASLWGKKVAGEQEIRKRNGGLRDPGPR